MHGINEWGMVRRIGLALVLSASIGLDRELGQKSAGLRTYTLVGVGSALFMLISKYGFFDVLAANEVVLDPSRIAAQIVAGIGFLGAGLIFVRRDSVRGLTTAAGVWLTAAVGAAAGASLPVLAIATTVGYFIVVYVLAPLSRRLPASPYAPSAVRVVYEDGRGILRDIITESTQLGLAIHRMATHQIDGGRIAGVPAVAVTFEVRGRRTMNELTLALDKLDGVLGVEATDFGEDGG